MYLTQLLRFVFVSDSDIFDVKSDKNKRSKHVCDSAQFLVCYVSKVTFSYKSMRDIFICILEDIF